jgi:hypothetical protein
MHGEREYDFRWRLMCEQIAQSFAMFGLLLLGLAHVYADNRRGVIMVIMAYMFAYVCWRCAGFDSWWMKFITTATTVVAIMWTVWAILEYHFYT